MEEKHRRFFDFFKRFSNNRVVIALGIVIAMLWVLAYMFGFLGNRAIHTGGGERGYTIDTVPSPFPGMPQVVVTSTKILNSPKSDWAADETPTFRVNVDKLGSSTTK